jgi:excisionase family DNA binding protein
MADWITTTEAVSLTRYNSEYIRRLVRTKKIAARKFGTIWQINRKSLLAASCHRIG